MPPSPEFNPKSTYVCGIDFGRKNDETAIVVLEKPAFQDQIYLIYYETHQNMTLTDAVRRVYFLDKKFNFKKINCDNTGLGIGPVDSLKELFKRDNKMNVVEGITFTNTSKGEMFTNLKLLFEQKKLSLPDDVSNPQVKKMTYQLLSIIAENIDGGRIKFSHEDRSHDDVVCALALAALYFRIGNIIKRKYGLAAGGNF
jgi:phage FluMu gp28-like protein